MLGIIIDSISTFMYSKLLVILLIGAGIYFTIRTKLPQRSVMKNGSLEDLALYSGCGSLRSSEVHPH